MVQDELLLSLFLLIGGFTLLFRAILLFKLPSQIQNPYVQYGLNKLPSSMLVALVVPFGFFVDKSFSPFKIEVYAILITIPLLFLLKKPGLSLPIGLVI